MGTIVPTAFGGRNGTLLLTDLDGNFTFIGGLTRSAKFYGAKGDGSTDDLQKINDGIAALSSDGGGTLLLPAGTWAVSSSIEYRDNVRIMGVGRGATIIKLLSGSSLTSSKGVIQPLNYGNAAPAVGYYTKNNGIAHLSVDGNKAGNAGVYECIVATSIKDCLIYDCETFGATEAGVHAQRHALGTDLQSSIVVSKVISHDNAIDGFQIQGVVVESCYAHDNSIGFHSAGNYSGGGDLTNIVTRISNCEATRNGSAGIVHDIQSGASIALLLENSLSHNNVGFGISISGMNDVAVTNVSSQYNTLDGIYIAGDRVTVTGGNFNNNTRAGVYADGTRTRVIINGIVATGNATGVQIISPTLGAGNVVANCALSGNATPISTLSASKWLLVNNTGFNPVGAFGNFGNPANPVPPGTGVSFANTYGYPVMIVVSGGTVSGIQINSISTGLTSGAFVLPPEAPGHLAGGGTMTLLYTVAPTLQVYGL